MQCNTENNCTIATKHISCNPTYSNSTTTNKTIANLRGNPKQESINNQTNKMQCLDLFSGGGGISLALSPYCTSIAYCDIDQNARDVLSARIQDGRLDAAPIFESIQSISPESLASAGVQARDINIVAGGFPCQDVSVAGRQMGLVKNTRSSLWKEIVRVAKFCGENGAEWIFLENVTGIIGLKENGIGAVLSELQREGYDIRWTTLSCGDLKAIHSRERWWCLCKKINASDTKDIRSTETSELPHVKPDYVHELLRRSDKQGKQACTSWSPKLPAFRVHHGVCSRLDENNRIRCGIVGNAVSPPVARVAFETLLGLQYLGLQDMFDNLDIKKIARNTQHFFSSNQLCSKVEENPQKNPQTKKKPKIPQNYMRITKQIQKTHNHEANALQDDLPFGWVVEVDIKYISKSIGRPSFSFFSPCGRKFRSLKTVQKFLGVMHT